MCACVRDLLLLLTGLQLAGAAVLPVSIPLSTNRVVFTQVSNYTGLVQAWFRNPLTISSLYFPFFNTSLAYRASFGSFFIMDNISPAATELAIPYCTLDIELRNCVFQRVQYQATSYNAQGNITKQELITVPPLSQYLVRFVNGSVVINPFNVRGRMIIPPPEININVDHRQIFFYFKEYGNLDHVSAKFFYYFSPERRARASPVSKRPTTSTRSFPNR